MGIPTTTKNAALDGITITHMSLHSAWPGPAGVLAELTGGSPAYARKTVTFPAGSGGSRVVVTPTNFDVPAGSTVAWVGLWNASTFVLALANGGATPKNFMAVPSVHLIYKTGHGFTAGQKLVFFDGTPPAGLTEGTIYFARDILSDTFAVAATSGGTAIAFSSESSFGCVVAAITEDVYGSQSTHQINTATLTVPD